MIYKLSMFEPLGYFHSHPECDPIPTKDDVQSMKINDIELIVTIEKKGRNMPWRYDASKKLLGSVLGEFRFELAAYTRTKSKSLTVKKLDLLCPFALGIGSKIL